MVLVGRMDVGMTVPLFVFLGLLIKMTDYRGDLPVDFNRVLVKSNFVDGT
jgi:hypothetical protein